MIKTIAKGIVSFFVLIGIWQFAFWAGKFNEALFPSPWSVGKALLYMMTEGNIGKDIAASLYRFGFGYLTAIVMGVLLGLLLGWFPSAFSYMNPIVQIIRPISPVAWIPLFVLWFGIGDRPAIVIIFIAAFFPVLLTTVSAVRSVDQIYFKIAKNFGLESWKTVWKIVFPEAFPQIANSFHLALGSAWVFLVAGEMSGAQSGLGFLIIDARNNLRTDLLLGIMLIIGMIGLLLDGLLRLFEHQLFRSWGLQERKGGR